MNVITRRALLILATVGAVVLPLLGVTPAATAKPAMTTYSTRVILQPTRSVYAYGDTISLYGTVQVYDPVNCSTGGWCTTPDTGNGYVTINRTPAGSTRPGVIASRDNEGDWGISTTSYGTATYSVYYTGGAYNSSIYFAPSSTYRVISGSRDLNGHAYKSGGRLWYAGQVQPDWKRKRVTIQRKACRSCRWRKVKVIRTNRKSIYMTQIGAPRRGKWFWRSMVKPTAPRFVRSYGDVWSTHR